MESNSHKPTRQESGVEDTTKNLSIVLEDVRALTSGGKISRGSATPRRADRRVSDGDHEDSDSSLSSLWSVGSGRQTRKRGRPPTTGEYVGLAEAKKKLVEERIREIEVETECRILDPTSAAEPCRSAKKLPDEEALRDELRKEPVSSLGAEILEAMSSVERVAACSQNLKGTSVRVLRLAAQKTKVAATEMAKRTGGDGVMADLRAENEVLREEIRRLREETGCLTREVEKLRARADMPPPQTPAYPVVPPSKKEADGKEDVLLTRIGQLIDRRLAAFYIDIFPEKAARPPLAADSGKVAAAKTKTKTVKTKTKTPAPSAAAATSKPLLPTAAAVAQPTPLWSQVVGRKAAKKAAAARKAAATTPTVPPKSDSKGQKGRPVAVGTKGTEKGADKTVRPPRAPKTAAVSLTVPEGGKLSYAEAMRSVRQKISLTDLGIEGLRPKRALTGGLILEIPGPEGAAKAKALAGKMTDVLAGTGVKVAQPTKLAELRVRGLDDSVTPDEVAEALAAAGSCEVGDIKTGEIRRSPTGLGTLWLRCPAAAARKAILAGRLRVGWVSAKVEALTARPLQCHRCLEMGHVRQRCTAEVDRSALCYYCGAPGHRAGVCTAKSPRCPLCADAGKPADHRMGSKSCSPPKRKGGEKGPKTGAPKKGKEGKEKPAVDSKPAQGGSGLEEAMEVV